VFGLVPRLSVAGAWGALTLCLLISLVGAALQLSQRVLDVSPFTHTPKIPGGTLSATPLVILSVIAVALGAVGLAGLRRRDIPSV
jgi:ABC-2 type transport system permease protein